MATAKQSERRTATKQSSELEVLTLAEAASYLRVNTTDVLKMVDEQGLFGRKIGAEWRFLKSTLRDWLHAPPRSNRDAILALAGRFKDDPFLESIVRDAYQERGRPIRESS